MSKGILYIVATPIGNLKDITIRALEVLKDVDMIAAEDTRNTLKLLNSYEIKNKLISYHEHNKKSKGQQLINILLEGKSIALVSDAGTPGISDPGEDIVRLAIENDIEVLPIPGAVAAISGLIISGLPTDSFVFEGFLAFNKKQRKEKLERISRETRTLILYEAPHKLLNTLKDLLIVLGDRKIALTRELTKKFEESIRTNISDAILKYEEQAPRGEFVLIIEGGDKDSFIDIEENKLLELAIEEHVLKYINEGTDKKDAIKKVAKERNISKREVYNKFVKYTELS